MSKFSSSHIVLISGLILVACGKPSNSSVSDRGARKQKDDTNVGSTVSVPQTANPQSQNALPGATPKVDIIPAGQTVAMGQTPAPAVTPAPAPVVVVPPVSEGIDVPGNIAGSGTEKEPPIPGALPGLANGRYFIKPFHSKKCLEPTGGSRDNKIVVVQSVCDESSKQKWVVRQVEPGYYRIVNFETQKVLEVANQISTMGAFIQQNDYFGAKHQMFKFVEANTGAYRIQTREGNKFFDVSYNTPEPGAKIQIWDRTNQDNQIYVMEPTL